MLEIKILLKSVGISNVNFVQNAVCVRCNLPDLETSKVMVVDMGKYLIDMSVLSKYDFINGRNYLIGGAEMDEAIKAYIEDNFEVVIGLDEAEII
ncbi:rod shape-determining protein [bacterium]|nr:rod shape-determining protein [bacterium]